eukprot:PITA_30892
MGRSPCCGDHEGIKRGPWTAEEDQKLIDHVQRHGLGNWPALPKLAGLSRCGKSCRLRWSNYLRPDIKRGAFSMHEDLTIIRLHAVLGNKWSAIASHLPGRTDNEIKNHWNTKLRKRLLLMGIDPVTHRSLPTPDMLSSFMASSSTAIAARLNSALVEAQLGRLARDYMNITHHVHAGSADHYSWQLSQILKLLGTHNNQVWAHPAGSLLSTSTDQFLQPDALRSLHILLNQINEGFVSGPRDDSTEYIDTSSEGSLKFFGLEKKSEGINLPISTDHGNHFNTTASLTEERPSAFETEIIDWNSMPILMSSSNPDKNDHLYNSGDKKSPSTTSTNSYNGGSDIGENGIQYHEDNPLGSAIRTSEAVSLSAARIDVQEDETNYWVNLLNSMEDSTPDLNCLRLPLRSQ